MQKARLIQGIDVSKYQGEIDWRKVKNAGMDFVIVRASFGWSKGQEDPFFNRNVIGAQAAGLAVGAYHYSYATTMAQARKEAELFYRPGQAGQGGPDGNRRRLLYVHGRTEIPPGDLHQFILAGKQAGSKQTALYPLAGPLGSGAGLRRRIRLVAIQQ